MMAVFNTVGCVYAVFTHSFLHSLIWRCLSAYCVPALKLRARGDNPTHRKQGDTEMSSSERRGRPMGGGCQDEGNSGAPELVGGEKRRYKKGIPWEKS